MFNLFREVAVLNAFRSMSSQSIWANEEGDPCIAAHWEWVTCTSTTPPRITKMYGFTNFFNYLIRSSLSIYCNDA